MTDYIKREDALRLFEAMLVNRPDDHAANYHDGGVRRCIGAIAALPSAPVSEERESAMELEDIANDLAEDDYDAWRTRIEMLRDIARLLRAPQQQGEPSVARIKELEDALRGLDPYLDQLVCFASTPQEYKPNRAIANARRALAGSKP